MLDFADENKLDMLIEIIRESKISGKPGSFPQLNAYDIEWLADKLKEVNDECSKVTEELYKTNQEFANYVEAHE